MAGVRRVSRSILRYVYPLYVIAVIVQVYLAGEGIFALKNTSVQLDDANSLNAHRDFGWIISQPVALLLLIVTLLAWLPGTRLRVLSILLPILLIIQSILPSGGRWVAALHPVNAFIILGLLGYLSSTFWRRGKLMEERAAAGTA